MRNKTIFIALLGLIMIIEACKSGGPVKTTGTVKQDSVGKKENAKQDTSHLVGMWLDQDIKTEKGEQVAYQIVSQGAKNYIQVVTFTGKRLDVNDNPAIAQSASSIVKKGNRYIGAQNEKEIYLIDKTGDLLIYDETGFIAKCKKLL